MKCILLIITLSFTTIALASEEGVHCESQLILPEISTQSLNLTRSVQATLGTAPYFCRFFKVSSDDANDVNLKKWVKTKLKDDRSKSFVDINKEIEATVLKVLEKVAMKKMWTLINETSRTKLYFSAECSGAQLNKWPMFQAKKDNLVNDPELDLKLVSNFKKLCQSGAKFESLAPYLSRDVVAESMLILGDVYPVNFKQVKKITCEGFNSTPEAILKDEKYEHFVLGDADIKDRKEFATWMKSVLDYHASLSFDGATIDEKVDELFQFQSRKKPSFTFLSTEETDAIESYTGMISASINGCLRRSNCDEETTKKINLMISGLKKLKAASKNKDSDLLFRGVASMPSFILSMMDEAITSGKAIALDKGFLSTTGIGKVAEGFAGRDEGGLLFVIKSKSCVGISDIARVKNEDEFLCPPNIKFIINRSEVPGVINLIEED